jgi:hypothetical protein
MGMDFVIAVPRTLFADISFVKSSTGPGSLKIIGTHDMMLALYCLKDSLPVRCPV